MPFWFLSDLHSLIEAVSPWVQQYGLWTLIVCLFFENLGIFFAPGESVLAASGFLAARRLFPLWAVLLVAVASASAGGFLAYGIGQRYGHRALLRYGKTLRITPAMLDRVHRTITRCGAPVFVIGRFIVPLRQLQGYIAGSAEVGFLRFAVWSSVGSVLWVLAWGGGAWFLAGQIPPIH